MRLGRRCVCVLRGTATFTIFLSLVHFILQQRLLPAPIFYFDHHQFLVISSVFFFVFSLCPHCFSPVRLVSRRGYHSHPFRDIIVPTCPRPATSGTLGFSRSDFAGASLTGFRDFRQREFRFVVRFAESSFRFPIRSAFTPLYLRFYSLPFDVLPSIYIQPCLTRI